MIDFKAILILISIAAIATTYALGKDSLQPIKPEDFPILSMHTFEDSEQNNTSDYWFKKGDEALKNEEFEEANRFFDQAIRINSSYTEAWLLKGNSLLSLGRYNEAIQAFDKAIELDPKDAAPWNDKGSAFYYQGKYNESVDAANKAIELDPEEAILWNNKGTAFYSQGKYNESIDAYNKAIELDPEWAKPWNDKGDVFYSQGKYNESIDAYNKAIELDPEWAMPWNQKGNVFYSQGKYNESIDAYNKAIELDPEWAAPWNNIGYTFYNQGKYNESIDAYNKAIDLDPKDASPWNGKGDVFYDQGKYNESIDTYNKAIELDPEYATPWNGKGNAFNSLGKNNESIDAYDKAIELDPKWARPWINKGYALYSQGKYDEAIKAYDEAINLGSNAAEAWNYKGNVFYSQSKYNESIDAYNRAIELDPTWAMPWNNKGSTLYSQGRYNESIDAYNKAIELDPHSARHWNDKGDAFKHLGSYNESIDAYNKAIELDPEWETPRVNKDYFLKILGKNLETEAAFTKDGSKLMIQSVDIDGNKAYLELIKDGRVIDSKVIIAANEVDDSYVYSKPGTLQTIKVHFKNAFRSANQSLATIDSVSQTSESNPSRILINNASESIVSPGTPLKLEKGYELAIQSVDIDGNKGYLELIKDGKVIDSKVIIAANEVDDSYVYSKPGTLQTIKVHFKNAFRSADQSLATIDSVSQTSESNTSSMLVNSTYESIITSGTPLKLKEGYELAIQSVDIDGNKVYVELIKDGKIIDSKVIITANRVDDNYVYSNTGMSQAIKVYFKNAFRGVDHNLATIDSVLQTSERSSSSMLINNTNESIVALGTPLKLEEGYELAIRSIDIDGNKVYLELIRDGKVIDSKVMVLASESDDNYIYFKPGASQIIKVHFKNAIRCADLNLATIDRVSQASEGNPSRILINDPYEKTVTSGVSLKLEEGYELAIQSVDIDGNRVYLELIKDGQVIDSKVIVTANGVDDSYIYSKPGASRVVKVHFKNAFRGPDQNLATIDSVSQTSESDPSRMLINSTNESTVTSGVSLKLEEGYELAIQSVDIDGNKVYLELIKEGQVIDSKVIVTANEVDDSYVYSEPGTSQEIKVHFKNVFRGADMNFVTIDNVSEALYNK